MNKPKTEDGLLIALRHPLRRAILRTMAKEPRLSPRQISDILEQPLSMVSYHVRVLRDNGAIELVGRAQVRGSVQHFYRLDIHEAWALGALGISDGRGGDAGQNG